MGGKVTLELPSNKEVAWFRRRLLRWFSINGREFPWRRRSCTSYQIILAEVLLQRTRAETVAEFHPRFVRHWPSWTKLAMASEEELRSFIQPIGLWRRRSASLLRLASEMARRRGRFPKKREEIESLPGVGQYITNAILLFCHGDPQPLLDVNMARVLERFFGPRKLVDIRYDPYLQTLSYKVVAGNDSVSTNWAVLDLASLVCKNKNPQCRICPLVNKCRYAEQLQMDKGY